MIAAGFIGLLGEATLELAPVSSYPLGPFLAALGFLATLLADYTAQALGGNSQVCMRGWMERSRKRWQIVWQIDSCTGVSFRHLSFNSEPLEPAVKAPRINLEMGSIDRLGGGAVRGRRQQHQAPGKPC